MDGTIDLCSGALVAGWAVENGLPAELEILVNSASIARIKCAVSRPDLVPHGYPVDAGFVFEFSNPLSASDVVSVRSLDGKELRNSPVAPLVHEGEVAICTASGVSGWAIAAGKPVELEILVNAELVASISCDKPGPQLKARGYPANSGFAFFFVQPLYSSDEVVVRFRDGPPLTPHPLRPTLRLGAMELCTVARVGGWAVENGQPAAVEVLVNGVHLARIQCDLKNQELPAHALPEMAGFSFRFPRFLLESDEVAVRFADGSALQNSPRRPHFHEGNIDSCRVSRVSGWALRAGQPAELDIFVNERRVVRIRCDGERPDLAAAGVPSNSGFAFRFVPPAAPTDEISVRYVDGAHVNGSPLKPQAVAPARLRRDSWQYQCKVVILLAMRESDMARCASLLESWSFKTDEATAPVPVFRRGRWEMIDFHERALGLLAGEGGGAGATDPLAILQRRPAAQSILDEMEEWLIERARRFSPCFIKDERAGQLLPLWNNIFGGADIKPLYVLCVADPATEDGGASTPKERAESAVRWMEFHGKTLAALGETPVCILPEEDWRDGADGNVVRLRKYLDLDSSESAASGIRANSGAIELNRKDEQGAAKPVERAKSLYRMIASCASAFRLDNHTLEAAREFSRSAQIAERPLAKGGDRLVERRESAATSAQSEHSARYANLRPAWIEIARAGSLFAMVTIKQALTAQYGQREAFSIYQLIMRYASDSRLVRRTPRSLRDYASQRSTSFHEIDAGGERFSVEPPEVIGEGNHARLEGVSRPIYLTCIADARVRGYSAFIEVGEFALFDDEPGELARVDELLEFDPAIFQADRDTVWITSPKDDGCAVRLEEAFNLIGCRTRVFGHWMWEYLPRFMAASMSGKLPVAPVLIDSNMPATHREALEMLLPAGTTIVELAPHITARVDRLWCAPSQMRLPLLVKISERFRWDHETSPPDRFGPIIREMARRTMSKVRSVGAGERVYLARNSSTHRKLVNHAIIEAVVRARGFRVVHPERMSFSEQAAALHNARYVIAPEGSALFLAFFAKPGTKICILDHPHTAGLPIYNGLFGQVGVETIVFTGPFARFDQNWPHMSDYQIDEVSFARFLSRWLGTSSR